MTTTTIPADPTKLACGPDRVEITPLHLSVNGLYDNGQSCNVHLVSNADLGVMLDSAERARSRADVPPHNARTRESW